MVLALRKRHNSGGRGLCPSRVVTVLSHRYRRRCWRPRCPGSARAADDFPNKPIRVDRSHQRPAARPICRGRIALQILNAKFGQPAVVNNCVWRGRRARCPRGRRLAAGRLYAAGRQHQHARRDPGGVGQRRLRPGERFRADRPHQRGLPDPRGASRTCRGRPSRSSSTTPRPIPARSTTATPGPGGLPHLAGANCSSSRTGCEAHRRILSQRRRVDDRRAEARRSRPRSRNRDPAPVSSPTVGCGRSAARTRPARRCCPTCRPWPRPACRAPRPTRSTASSRRPARRRTSSRRSTTAMNEGLATDEMQKTDHRPRQRIEAELAGGVRRLHRRAEQDLDRGRQGRRREDRLEPSFQGRELEPSEPGVPR